MLLWVLEFWMFLNHDKNEHNSNIYYQSVHIDVLLYLYNKYNSFDVYFAEFSNFQCQSYIHNLGRSILENPQEYYFFFEKIDQKNNCRFGEILTWSENMLFWGDFRSSIQKNVIWGTFSGIKNDQNSFFTLK